MKIDWMSWKEEVSQRHENLMLHGFEGMSGGYIAMSNGMSLPIALASSVAFGVLWEVGGNVISRFILKKKKKKKKPWKASVLGLLSYPAGTLAAGAIRSLGG